MEFHLIFGHVSSSRNQQELFRHPRADSGIPVKLYILTTHYQHFFKTYFTVTWLMLISRTTMNQRLTTGSPSGLAKQCQPIITHRGFWKVPMVPAVCNQKHQTPPKTGQDHRWMLRPVSWPHQKKLPVLTLVFPIGLLIYSSIHLALPIYSDLHLACPFICESTYPAMRPSICLACFYLPYQFLFSLI